MVGLCRCEILRTWQKARLQSGIEGRNSPFVCVYGCHFRSVCLVVGQSLPGVGPLKKQDLQRSLEQQVFPPEEPQREMTSCDSATFFNDYK